MRRVFYGMEGSQSMSLRKMPQADQHRSPAGFRYYPLTFHGLWDLKGQI